MFEQSMVVSCAGGVARGPRWTLAGSVIVQCCLALLLVALPLLHPERMLVSGTASRLSVPLPRVEMKPVKVERVEATRTAATVAAAVAVSAPRVFTAPAKIPHGIREGDPPHAEAVGSLRDMAGIGTALPGALADAGPTARVAVVASGGTERRGPLRVSSGVGAGMLMTPIRPVYPPIARAAHVEGVVVVEATISREGRIERARLLSGPPMLAGAALEAVRTARYTPYRLNGDTVEVETTITVNFRLGT